jgi:hypothetical protein
MAREGIGTFSSFLKATAETGPRLTRCQLRYCDNLGGVASGGHVVQKLVNLGASCNEDRGKTLPVEKSGCADEERRGV